MNPIQLSDMVQHYNNRIAQLLDEFYTFRDTCRNISHIADQGWSGKSADSFKSQLEKFQEKNNKLLVDVEKINSQMVSMMDSI